MSALPPRAHRLLILACSATKRQDDGYMPAIDRYDGPLWQTVRCHAGDRKMLKVTVLSARYGFLDSRSPIQNYGTHFTGEFADRMMGGGLGHAGHGRLFPQAGQFRDRRGLRDGFAQGAWRSAFHRFPLRLVSVLTPTAEPNL